MAAAQPNDSATAPGVTCGRPLQQRVHRPRGAEAERDADGAAGERQDDRLDQELQQHVEVARADRQAQADLARPLGHRHQHDVHDADAADQQRHRGDARPAGRSSSSVVDVSIAGHLLHASAPRSRRRRRRCDAVPLPQQARRSPRSSSPAATPSAAEMVMLDDVLHAEQPLLHRRVGHDDRVVLVLPASPPGPCWSSTPITVNGWFLHADRRAGRIGAGAEQLIARRPSRAPRPWPRARRPASVKNAPNCIGHERICGSSALVPWTCVFQLARSAMICDARVQAGRQVADARHLAGGSPRRRRRSAWSSRPAPPRTGPKPRSRR